MKYTVFVIMLLYNIVLQAQTENKVIQEGNDKYQSRDYSGAQEKYAEALKTNPSSDAGNFNMGNALFLQKDFESAITQFKKAAEQTTDPTLRSQAFHNMGNSYLEQQKFKESIDAYKQALRYNPDDVDTKYNLSYAQKMLKQKQEQQQKENEKQDDQKKEEEKKEEEKKEDQQPQQKKDEQQSQPKQYSKEELERIMQALNEDDKNVQEKVNKQKVQSSGANIEKDW